MCVFAYIKSGRFDAFNVRGLASPAPVTANVAFLKAPPEINQVKFTPPKIVKDEEVRGDTKIGYLKLPIYDSLGNVVVSFTHAHLNPAIFHMDGVPIVVVLEGLIDAGSREIHYRLLCSGREVG